MPDLRLTVSASPAEQLPDGVCRWSQKDFLALVERIRAEVPASEGRKKSLNTISVRLDPTVQLQQENEIAAAWRDFASRTPSEEAFNNARVAIGREVGCEGDNAAYVVRGMISHFIARGGPTWQVTLARLFLDPVQCPPASHLSDQAALKLHFMAGRI